MKMSKVSPSDGHVQSTTAGDVRVRNTNPDILLNTYMFVKKYTWYCSLLSQYTQ